MRWEKAVGLVLVAVALLAFFPGWVESLYGRFVAPYVYALSPAFYSANAKGVVIAWCGILAVIGGLMFFKK
jgi:hypothetical protein